MMRGGGSLARIDFGQYFVRGSNHTEFRRDLFRFLRLSCRAWAFSLGKKNTSAAPRQTKCFRSETKLLTYGVFWSPVESREQNKYIHYPKGNCLVCILCPVSQLSQLQYIGYPPDTNFEIESPEKEYVCFVLRFYFLNQPDFENVRVRIRVASSSIDG